MGIQFNFTAMVIWAIVIINGGLSPKGANKNSEEYFSGRPQLGPLGDCAMSAYASDITSGGLLMGLPGVAYWCGIADAAWTAIGLLLGTYINRLIGSKRPCCWRVRRWQCHHPSEYFSNRFMRRKGGRTIAAILYPDLYGLCGSCLVTCKLFSTLLDALFP